VDIVPTIDLRPWFEGTGRGTVAQAVDAALQRVGFLLVIGHGVPQEERAAVRAAARRFFDLPVATKDRYAVTVGGRGWLPPGVEANGNADLNAVAAGYRDPDALDSPADLKESFAVGADQRTGDPQIDGYWFRPNSWPAEVPELRGSITRYLARMRALADELLVVCAVALGLADDFFTSHTGQSTYTMNVNWYPPMHIAGAPQPNQFRIGPHSDFGTLTVLDREPGRGGLQVWTPDQGWQDAPYHPDALTINAGDLLARWSGDRWQSNRHRVLPPQAEAPDEDLISLVYFYEADHDAVVNALQPPIGRPNDYPPVVAASFLRERLDAITVR
jgi:isopenicillin N synthase-like dioxygenase